MDTPSAPQPEPDEKDWTWVLTRPCDQCGYDASLIEPRDLPTLIREHAAVWADVLARPDARERPESTVWSPVEYGAHVRDVLVMFAARVGAILDSEGPVFQNFDQDAAALERGYAGSDPAAVAREIDDAADFTASEFARVGADDWARTGTRSDGVEFSVAALGVYCIHELDHHAWDVHARDHHV